MCIILDDEALFPYSDKLLIFERDRLHKWGNPETTKPD